MLHIITLLAIATAIALGIYLAYFPHEEGFYFRICDVGLIFIVATKARLLAGFLKRKDVKNINNVLGIIFINKDDDNQNDDVDNEDNDEVNVSEDDDDQNDDNADNEGDDDQDDDNEHTESNNDDDDLVHPKLSTFNEKERQDEIDKEEEWSDDEAYDDETQGVNVEGEELDEEETNEEDITNIQGTQVTEDTHVIITAATFEVQQQSSSVSSGFISNMLNPNPDTATNTCSTPTIVPSTSLQNLPTFGSLFKFEDRVKALEDDFSEFKQTNQFATTVASIPGIVDTYLANKMNEAVKTDVQLQSDKLRIEPQADNEDFINKIDEKVPMCLLGLWYNLFLAYLLL
ncbi:hypothetical protein Tco_0536089 [Tanacetum coccineum]